MINYKCGTSFRIAEQKGCSANTCERRTTIEKSNKSDIITSVEKASALLLLFENCQIEELSISEMAQMLSIPKTTVHRLVTTLVQSLLLEQNNENKKYRLGIKLYLLGNCYLQAHTLEKISHRYLKEVVRTFGETCSISVLDNTEMVIIDKMDGVHSIRVISQIGTRNPVHCSGSGKVFLGFMDEEKQESLLQKLVPLKKITPYTITDPRALLQNVKKVRHNGYAYDEEEINLGQICISAPIYNSNGKVYAAMTVSGPKARITEKGIDVIGNQLKDYCMHMSKELGYLCDSQQ